jgi:hypothetical protein
MNEYLELKKKQEAEFNAFPMFFAFNKDQFADGMKKLGLLPDQLDMIYKFNGGGFYKRSDSKDFHALLKRHTEEVEAAIKDDTKGDGYIFEMFRYELANHEYGYTGDEEDTLNALGLSMVEIEDNPALKEGLRNAKIQVCSEFMG